jgi:FAD/FMN-containing dehydrogenase/Fe-S oxidoreductase
MEKALTELGKSLEGNLHFDTTNLLLYATDASAYREIPLAVAFPKSAKDIKKLIQFASKNDTSLIPRTAGTSLAGQVVGDGIVVDVSKHFTQVLEVNKQEGWVKVQPGVIRDDLNRHLAEYSIYFGPETSTANRAMIGGMVGNNSCGSNSIVYGSTRDHLMEVKGLLSDGSEVVFNEVSDAEFSKKCELNNSEGKLYQHINELLSNDQNRAQIKESFPKPSIPRRNTGYAIDLLADSKPFATSGQNFNFCKLIAGSEGTLVFITEIKLKTIPLPPKHKALVCIHCNDINESLLANLEVVKHNPHASELMDKYILDCTKENIEQSKNRFFIKGDPGAILVAEIVGQNYNELNQNCENLISSLKAQNLGYHFPILKGKDIGKIWTLRKAGLGLLSNVPGDAKPVPVIEDTAVDVADLPAYIKDFNKILDAHGMTCVHYAHAGSGELHLRPIINLKTKEGHQKFRMIAEEITLLVKKYKGSLSGEHGDGRLRGEFIKTMIGEANYQLIESVKRTWDPKSIFNPGKITDTAPMDSNLRYEAEVPVPDIDTYFDFTKNQGVLRASELCNGSGDCRKSALSGGTMCPSYMATKDEKDTTRARANMLREVLTNSTKANRFDSEELKEVMDLCLSCKGCKSECPSNVDMARLKAEFQQNYYDVHGMPLTKRLMGSYNLNMKLASIFPPAYNFIFSNKLTGNIAKRLLGVSTKRSMPHLANTTLRTWSNKQKTNLKPENPQGKVYFFCDEFTNFLDTEIGQKAIQVLVKLNYEVIVPEHTESGRALISKGMVRAAKKVANKNITLLSKLVSEDAVLVGLEPSAILTLRDEYPDLCDADLKNKANSLASNTYTFEEFISKEFSAKNIALTLFSNEKKHFKIHGHCHQKALSSVESIEACLSIPKNYTVESIQSGCCGMAGSFGYEKEHYDVSMQIGKLVLFPEVEKTEASTAIVAPGTSCRHQILDGTGRQSFHPAEVLFEALN